MKKTISISLGGFNYQIEEDAYEELKKYLDKIKAHFASFPDADEIVSDMEARMAEQFENKTSSSKILTLPMIQELIGIMGSPEQFNDEKTNPQKPENEPVQNPNKRLLRNTDDAILAGVCGGISSYLGVNDPLWIRLIFILSIFFGGFGILLYIILWIILPAAKTDTEKMQMRGEPINLKSLEATVKERVAELKNHDPEKTKQALKAPFQMLAGILTIFGKFFLKLFAIFIKIIGFFLILVSALIMAGVVFATIGVLFNFNSPYIDFPIREVLTGLPFYAAIVSAFFILFVPLVFMIKLGSGLFDNKSAFTKKNVLSLFAVWIIAVSIFTNLGIQYAPQIENLIKTGSYSQTGSKNIDLKDFKAIELNSAYEATVIKSDKFEIVATGSQKELDKIRTYKKDATFIAEQDHVLRFCLFCFNRAVKFQIFMPELNSIDLSGASRITTEGFSSEEFKLKLSGASTANLNIIVTKLIADLSGASKLEIEGKIEKIDIELSGASQAKLKAAEIKNAELELSGASSTYLNTLDSLNVHASGASKVYYINAADIQSSLTGASRVVQTNE